MLSFDAFGVNQAVCADVSCGAFRNSNVSADTVQVDGTTVGLAQNGTNQISLDADSLAPGEHTIRLDTGSLFPNLTLDEAQAQHLLDDFEYKGLTLGFGSTS